MSSSTARVAKTFWFRLNGGAFYLIPDDAEVPAGEVELRTLTGARKLVDAEAAKQWAADEESVREHLSTEVRGELAKFSEELGAAWRRGLDAAMRESSRADGSVAPTGAESPSAESRDARAKQQFDALAKEFVAELESLKGILAQATKASSSVPNEVEGSEKRTTETPEEPKKW